MNTYRGTIEKVRSHEGISIVDVACGRHKFKSVILNENLDMKRLEKGAPISVMIKETEVIIVANKQQDISLRNKIPCTITTVSKGALLSSVTMTFDDKMINSIITTEAVDNLELFEGKEVTAMIKTNEVMLSY